MMRAILKKVMWVGKATTFLVGLAVIVGLTAGLVSQATAANGQSLILGINNSATAVTKLIANIANPALQLWNTNTNPGATALSLVTSPSRPPMAVTSSTKVANLNADKVDGKDAPLWAVVDATGALARSNGATSSNRSSTTGLYTVVFNKPVQNCAYTATIGTANTGFYFDALLQATNSSESNNAVVVQAHTLAGNVAERGFHLTVNC